MSDYRLGWVTDPHLNFASKENLADFFESIIKAECDGLLITGDIAEGNSVVKYIQLVHEVVKLPVYYVLGNHDFYHSSFEDVRASIFTMGMNNRNLTYLTEQTHLVKLCKGTYLVGTDGWYDAQLEDPYNSNVALWDWQIIHNFFDKQLSKIGIPGKKQELIEYCRKIADDLTMELEVTIRRAILNNSDVKTLIIATHVPPWREAATYKGKISDHNWLPWFTNKSLGDMISVLALDYPQITFKVFCGHTHGGSKIQLYNNLTCETGKAEYKRPELAGVIELKE